jgi:hypothetical protein
VMLLSLAVRFHCPPSEVPLSPILGAIVCLTWKMSSRKCNH